MNFFNKYFPSQEAVQLWDDSVKMNEQLQFIVDWAREQNFDIKRYTEDVFSVLSEEIKNYPYYEENNRQGGLNKKLFEVYYSLMSMYLIVQESNLNKLKDYVKLFDIRDRYALSVDFRSYEHWHYSLGNLKVQEETQCIFEQAQLKMGLIVYVYFKETKYFRPSSQVHFKFIEVLNTVIYQKSDFGINFVSLFDVLYDNVNKVSIYLQMLNNREGEGKVNQEVCTHIRTLCKSAIESFNREHVLQLDFDVLTFHYQSLSIYRYFGDNKKESEWEDKVLTVLKQKVDQKGKGRVLDSLVYLIGTKYMSGDKKFITRYLSEFMYPLNVSTEWLAELFRLPYKGVSNDNKDLILAPLLTQRDYTNDSFDLACGTVRELLYSNYRIHDTHLTPVLVTYLQDMIPPIWKGSIYGKSLNRQLYSGLYDTILGEKPTKHPQIDQLVSYLNYYGVCSLKEMHKVFYVDSVEETMCVLNFNGIDYELHRYNVERFAQEVTAIFIDHELPYIMVPVLIYHKEDIHYKDKKVYSYCICNREQIELLATAYDMVIPGGRELPYGEPDFFEVMYNNVSEVKETKRSPQLDWFYNAYFKDIDHAEVFIEIIEYLYKTKPQKKVNPKWLEEFNKLYSPTEIKALIHHLSYVFSSTKNEHFWLTQEMATIEKNMTIVLVNYLDDNKALLLVKGLVENAYKKVYGVGAKMVATGNFMLEILAKSNQEEAFGILTQLRESTKYNTFLVALDKYIDIFLDNTTLSAHLLRDKSTPAYRFNDMGVHEIVINGWGSIVLRIEEGKLSKSWVLLNGVVKKTFPATLKHVHDMDDFKIFTKELNKALVQLKNRIRLYWLEENEWSSADWQAYIYGHPLMGHLLKNMVWSTSTGREFIYSDDKVCVDVKGNKVVLSEDEHIKLWHPLLATTESIVKWQKYILEHSLKQLEKQVFRECYTLAKDDKQYSQQFADHYLLNNKLMAISSAIGWVYPYSHYGEGHPRRYLKHLDVTVHYMLDYERGAVANRSSKVLFYKGNNTKESDMMNLSTCEEVAIEEVSPLVLSEVFRDIDLFVSTTSIANNPDLKGEFELYDSYLKEYKLGKLSQSGSAKTRRQILENLAGFLGIDLIGFEGNFMLIKGKEGDYRINLGSGFVQDVQTNQHIDMRVTKSSLSKDQKVRIPLIEDDTLSVIIAKAQYLVKN